MLLHCVVQRGSYEVIALLFEKGADVHARDIYGIMPLHIAGIYDNRKIADILSEKYANIHVKNHEKSM